MDKPTAKTIGEEAAAALTVIAKKHGMTVRYGGGSYDPVEGTYKPKIEFREVGEDVERRAFVANAALYGLTEKHFRARFEANGKTYELTGFALNRSRYPVKGRLVTGREAIATGKDMLFAETILRHVDSKAYAEYVARFSPIYDVAESK